MNMFKPLNLVDGSFGGKAMGLKRLIDAGVNVPTGISFSAENLLKIIKHFPQHIKFDIIPCFNNNDLIAVKSSALNEGGTEQSFARQYKAILNVPNSEKTSFKDFLNGIYDPRYETLDNSFKFFNAISNFRNNICQKFVDIVLIFQLSLYIYKNLDFSKIKRIHMTIAFGNISQ